MDGTFYTFFLAMRMWQVYFKPRQQLNEAKLREIVAVEGDKKVAADQIVNI